MQVPASFQLQLISEGEGLSMKITEMIQRKEERGYTDERISELTGVPIDTVQKIFEGEAELPGYGIIMALEKLFGEESGRVEEPVAALQLKKSGEYTLRDYYSLPDEYRVELIDGVIYDMSSPTSIHQMISAEICHALKEYIGRKRGNCVPFAAPIDVQLDRDDKTMVQPDILIVCDKSKITMQCIFGAPDFIAEILSSSTRHKDMTVKLKKYSEAGVREYWMVDPDKKKIMVYDLEKEEFPVIYGFDAKIPVKIFDGECTVDFAEIYENIKFLYA